MSFNYLLCRTDNLLKELRLKSSLGGELRIISAHCCYHKYFDYLTVIYQLNQKHDTDTSSVKEGTLAQNNPNLPSPPFQDCRDFLWSFQGFGKFCSVSTSFERIDLRRGRKPASSKATVWFRSTGNVNMIQRVSKVLSSYLSIPAIESIRIFITLLFGLLIGHFKLLCHQNLTNTVRYQLRRILLFRCHTQLTSIFCDSIFQ